MISLWLTGLLLLGTQKMYKLNPEESRASLISRFWKKVNKTDTCWLWEANTNNKGYGTIWVKESGKKELAHRTAWFLETGEWPTENVLHTCDTTLCVRHSHHFQGTQRDNLKDMRNKGRGKGWKEGENNNAKKTHCPRGHPYSGGNLHLYAYGKYTYRRCKACQ